MDTDKDGCLSKKELLRGLQKLFPEDCLDKSDVEKIFTMVDVDKNGEISYSEFLAVTVDRRQYLTKNRLKLVFKFFDVDESGCIDIDEIAKVFKL